MSKSDKILSKQQLFETSVKPNKVSYNITNSIFEYKNMQQLHLQVKRTKQTLNQNQRLMKIVVEKMNKLVDMFIPTFEKLKSYKQT